MAVRVDQFRGELIQGISVSMLTEKAETGPASERSVAQDLQRVLLQAGGGRVQVQHPPQVVGPPPLAGAPPVLAGAHD
jgi:hypothetical protein